MSSHAKPGGHARDVVPVQRFDVAGLPASRQLLAWRDSVGHVIDVVPTKEQAGRPFHAGIDRYRIGNWLFSDCTSDAMTLERSIARISTDGQRGYAFHVFLEGEPHEIHGLGRRSQAGPATVLALDLDQPMRMRRGRCRVLTLFVPRPVVDAALPHADALHGRVLQPATPLIRLLADHVRALGSELGSQSPEQAGRSLDTAAGLLVGAFGQQARLSGTPRAAVRAALFDRARRYVHAHLHDADLTPDKVIRALQLPRASIYRLFEHEGGLGAYIRHRRLREAASELLRYSGLPVADVGYGLGFASASDFSRAFRRAFGLSPGELREAAWCKAGGPAPGMAASIAPTCDMLAA
ncbi:helix-turn-helix domain-containing protein [Bordetella sp. 2513F-2]